MKRGGRGWGGEVEGKWREWRVRKFDGASEPKNNKQQQQQQKYFFNNTQYKNNNKNNTELDKHILKQNSRKQ